MVPQKRTTFIFMGDPHYGKRPGERSDYLLWGQLLRGAYAMAFPADSGTEPLLVLSGDVVNKPDREDEWAAFFEAGGETLRRMRVITATGNHSLCRVATYEARFDLPGNGPKGLEQRFFSFDHGCCHFIVLDSCLMGWEHAGREHERRAYESREHDREHGGEMLRRRIRDWIREDLRRSTRPVTFAVMHHPVVTVGSSDEDEQRAEYMRKEYLPLLEEAGVDMILCGHQHVYCRSKPIRTKARKNRSTDGAAYPASGADPGMIQLMGVSGTKLFDARNTSRMEQVREHVSLATVFDATEEEIRLRTIDGEGCVLDELIRPARKKARP